MVDPPLRRQRVEEMCRKDDEAGLYEYESIGKNNTKKIKREDELESHISSSSSSSSLLDSSLASTSSDVPERMLESTAGMICNLVSSTTDYTPVSSSEEENTEAENDLNKSSAESVSSPPSYSHEDVIIVALKVAPLWFLANCGYNYSLLLTSVGSSTIIRCYLSQ